VAAGNEGCTADFRHDRVVGLNLGLAYHAPVESASCPQNTPDDDFLITGYFTLSMMQNALPLMPALPVLLYTHFAANGEGKKVKTWLYGLDSLTGIEETSEQTLQLPERAGETPSVEGIVNSKHI